MGVNSELLKLAQWRVANSMNKEAIVPAGAADPMAGGGMPPMDPMAGGGMPPMDPMAGGGMPPMDPMAGGMPPMDPMAEMMPPGAPPVDAEAIRAVIKEELAASGGGGAANGNGAAKAKKFDPAELDGKLHNMEKLLAAMANALGVSLPPESLISPTPEPEEAPPGAESGPDAVSAAGTDVYAGAQDPSMGSAISPIEPMQPAMPEAGGMPKASTAIQHVGSPISMEDTVTAQGLLSKTAALAHMARSANNRGN